MLQQRGGGSWLSRWCSLRFPEVLSSHPMIAHSSHISKCDSLAASCWAWPGSLYTCVKPFTGRANTSVTCSGVSGNDGQPHISNWELFSGATFLLCRQLGGFARAFGVRTEQSGEGGGGGRRKLAWGFSHSGGGHALWLCLYCWHQAPQQVRNALNVRWYWGPIRSISFGERYGLNKVSSCRE